MPSVNSTMSFTDMSIAKCLVDYLKGMNVVPVRYFNAEVEHTIKKFLRNSTDYTELEKILCYAVFTIINKQCEAYNTDDTDVLGDRFITNSRFQPEDIPISEKLYDDLLMLDCYNATKTVYDKPVYLKKEDYEEEVTFKHSYVSLEKFDSVPIIRKEIVFRRTDVENAFHELKTLFTDMTYVRIPTMTRVRLNASQNIIDLKAVLVKERIRTERMMFNAKKCIEVNFTSAFEYFECWSLFNITGDYSIKCCYNDVKCINSDLRVCMSDKSEFLLDCEIEKLSYTSVKVLKVALTYMLWANIIVAHPSNNSEEEEEKEEEENEVIS